MATAQNGWPVVPDTDAGRRKLTDLVLPGAMPHKVRVLAGDVATIARWHVAEYHRRVEPIEPAGCWGWNVRKIGDGPDWSNHAAACAWDINAEDNPDGAPPSRVMTPPQIHECHKLERESDGVLRWGGDWSDPDPMHWEIVGTPAQAAALAKKIRNEEDDVTRDDIKAAVRELLLDDDDAVAVKLRARPWQYKGGGLQGATTTLDALGDSQAIAADVATALAELALVRAEIAAVKALLPPPPA